MNRFITIWAVIVVSLVISPHAMQARNLLAMEKIPESSSSSLAPTFTSKALAEELFGRYPTQPQLIVGVDRRCLTVSNPSPDIGH